MLEILLLAVFQPIFASILPETYQLPLVPIIENITAFNEHSVEMEPRISYAETVRNSDYPYYARLECCGGAILSDRWVVTAAHCVYPEESARKCISLGNGCAEIKNIVIHPGYQTLYDKIEINDIALLELKKPLEFNDKVQPLGLPKLDEDYDAKSNYVFIGTGADETGQLSRKLKKVEAKLFPTEVCYRKSIRIKAFNTLRPLIMFLNETSICAQRVDRPELANNGDFGGPVVKDNVLVGLASYTISPGDKRVYLTNVAYYVDWIKQHTEYFSIEESDSSHSSGDYYETFEEVDPSPEESE